MKQTLDNFYMWHILIMLIIVGFLFKYIWLLAILQAYYIGKITNTEKYKLRLEKRKKERKEKYLKKFRILKLTMGEWMAIIIFILIIFGLVLLYI